MSAENAISFCLDDGVVSWTAAERATHPLTALPGTRALEPRALSAPLTVFCRAGPPVSPSPTHDKRNEGKASVDPDSGAPTTCRAGLRGHRKDVNAEFARSR